MHCSPVEITFMTMWTGAVGFNIAGVSAAFSDGTISQYISAALQPGVLAGILYLSVLSSVVAFFGVNFALSKLHTSNTAAFANLTTVVSVLAGVLIGGEPLYGIQIGGMALILLSIWGIAGEGIPRGKKLREEPLQPDAACSD